MAVAESAEGVEGASLATPLVDLHSHLVPNVDDGARTPEDVLEGVGRMVDRGVGRILTTPHLDGSLTLNRRALEDRLGEMDEAWTSIRRVVADRFPEVDFGRAHEILLDVPAPDLSDPRLRFPDTDRVLVEWPRLQIPPGTHRVLASLRSQGVRPVVAHPERYRGFDRELTLASRWREEGAYLQMNHGSLVGRYGSLARTQALLLLERGGVDCLATDFHGRSHLRLYIREVGTLFETGGAREAWTLLTRVNPDRILRGEAPLPVPGVTFPRGILGRIRTLFGTEG